MSALGMRFEVTRDMPYSRNESRGRWVDVDSSEEDMTMTAADKELFSKCCYEMYCSKAKGRDAKMCQIAVYTITGGIIGAGAGSILPGPGTAAGLGIGLGVGFVIGCIKAASN